MKDYENRDYLSAIEVAEYLGLSVKDIHRLTSDGVLQSYTSASGQYRYRLDDVKNLDEKVSRKTSSQNNRTELILDVNQTTQTIYINSSQTMEELEDNSIHLSITSPPYFNAKMYSNETIEGDLGNVHHLDEWFSLIAEVWAEVYRVLQPGRKFFLNIMNLPIREGKSFRSLNLVGKSIDLCESIGFVFRRDIVWHKTNGVKAHFGTYPYPGGILINNMHEFIIEFAKPEAKGAKKYAHVTQEQREASKLDKDFWLSLKNSDVWLMKPEQSGDGRKHIAPFPLELPYRLVKAYSFVGETVLDPFAGSGTTLVASAKLGRNGIGYEINPGYARRAVDIIKEDWID
jgi:DNA modification methylase